MKQKSKDPKLKSNLKYFPKNNSNNNESEALSDELFVLPFLSESLIRKQEQITQSYQKTKSKNTLFPIINQNKSPFVSSSKIFESNKPNVRKSQPNSAISNKSSKSSKSNISNISSKYDPNQKSLRDFEEFTKSTPRLRVLCSQINGNKFFITPEATSINKFHNTNKKDYPKQKEIRGILKNSLLAPIKDHSNKLESNSFLEKSYELLEFTLQNPNVSPNFDRNPLSKMNVNTKENDNVYPNKTKISFEPSFTSSYVNKNLNIKKFFNENIDNNLKTPNYIPDIFMSDYKNRLSQINEESSNNTTPSLCSAWSSSFSSIISDDLIENSIFTTNTLNNNIKTNNKIKNSLDKISIN
ncbi:unnamed protein product [Brachionus calyciflorus]|uniref:Uncharacterized protein n=1 Tax=Brachionus calyciflorus TaxID=104777 RepID=A0A813Q6G6_9BILA|nr:unnamed protein product [Brachionus calyciflorus]